MADQPIAGMRPQQGAGTGALARVGVLADAERSLGTAAMLLEVAGVTTVEARSATEFQALVRDGGIAAVVVDPECGEGWPVNTAETMVMAVAGHVPVLLLCRHASDAQILQQRFVGPAVSVLLYDQLDADHLGTIIKGAIAAQGTRPKATAPS